MIRFFQTPQKTVIATEVDHALSEQEIKELSWLYGDASLLDAEQLEGYYVGPRREMVTPWSTNAVEITQNMGLSGISRIEELSRDSDSGGEIVMPSSELNFENFANLPDNGNLQGSIWNSIGKKQGASSMEFDASVQKIQYKGKFIVLPCSKGLMVVNQHRAHVRVLFDLYIRQVSQGVSPSQGLLFPEIIQLAPSEAVILETIMPDLLAVGFELTSLGGGSYAINGVPVGIEGLSPVELVRNMVNTSIEKGNDIKEEMHQIVALTLANAAAIVYGQVLTTEEMTGLVDQLFSSSTPNYTPDGRLIVTTITDEEIGKVFK